MGETRGFDPTKIVEKPPTPEVLRRRELAKESREFPLDERRERDYQAITDRLKRELLKEGKPAADILLAVLKPQLDMLPPARREIFLNDKERASVKLAFVQSLDACGVAKREIVRPVFLIENADITNRISAAFRGNPEHAGRSHGFVVAYPEMKAAGKQDVMLIIARDDRSTINHEILHTIDPQERSGYDRAIDEIFAFYESQIIDGYKDDWAGLKDRVTDRQYFDTYDRQVRADAQFAFADTPKVPKLTYEQWKAKVEHAVNNVHGECIKRNDGARRRLARAKTLDEILAWDDLD